MSDPIFDDVEVCQAVLMDYYRHPRGHGRCEGATHEAEAHNPACGDVVKLGFRVEEGLIVQARMEGAGCAVSQASASLLVEQLEGRTVREAREVLERLGRFLAGEEAGGVAGNDVLGKLAALRIILANPARVRCAGVAAEAVRVALGEG